MIRAPILAAVLLCLLGCAVTPPPARVSVTRESSADLQAVAAAAQRLANQLGADNVWVAFDLDNTLLAMRTELGANQWYDWQSALSRTQPCHPHLVSDRLAVQGALYHAGAMRLTQPDAPALVAALAQAGHPVLIVTARGPDYRLPTFRELRRNGLFFRDFSPGPLGGESETFTLPAGTRGVRYEDGVLMLAGQHKGLMLMDMLVRYELAPPAAIVFADDKPENIDEMAEGLAHAGIGGHLVHYTGEDSRVAQFDADAAAQAWARLAPALETVEAVMGTHNHDIPDPSPVGCGTP